MKLALVKRDESHLLKPLFIGNVQVIDFKTYRNILQPYATLDIISERVRKAS